ncbi:type 2 isopentenyl-diphosphate Delta-isomerase [Secundilactobacillus paracollinoides]|uniref:type 2 isopentenyl-diphosphate Delta-isomerase n=1 Tax=Secundilactobacillus paracollinoides TaxID=240427 RepID=UPI00081A83A4|nr:type 2 isopentenyl-diphosphate Delta-isomerase [Secundilactobacillus paracollinoides]ANZ63785.1 type 2 isopentenyl-diphosphate Delta-isomerase [Secundilactobacillus paracollinoides]
MTSKQSHRKDEHVSLAEKFYQQPDDQGFKQVRLIHESLPELALTDINTQVKLGAFQLPFPVMIEAMTGGSERTGRLNDLLSQLAKAVNLPMAVGSQSVAIREPELAATFSVARLNDPVGILFANMGANHSLKAAKTAIDMIQANALQLHINAAQETVMPEGDQDFRWLKNIQQLVADLNVPAIVKEVGFGMTAETVQQLMSVGVQAVDISGRGGTDFAKIENFRRGDKDMAYLADWGLTTVESLLEMRRLKTKPVIIASGGIKTPLDAIKALVLGADCVAMAGEVLHHLIQTDLDATIVWFQEWLQQFKQLMLLVGAKNVGALTQVPVVFDQPLVDYMQQRGIEI